MIAKNARFGARSMYEDRKLLRRFARERMDEGARRARRNMIFPRLTFHLIYLRRFGFRRWLTD